MMRPLLPLSLLLLASACDQPFKVPTVKDLKANPHLLTEWREKCDTGKYSRLSAEKKEPLCWSTREADRSLSVEKAGKEANDFYDANTLRKEKPKGR